MLASAFSSEIRRLRDAGSVESTDDAAGEAAEAKDEVGLLGLYAKDFALW